jgi:hypothetical protein
MSARCCDAGYDAYPAPCPWHDDPTLTPAPQEPQPQRWTNPTPAPPPPKPKPYKVVLDVPPWLNHHGMWGTHPRRYLWSPWPSPDRLVQPSPPSMVTDAGDPDTWLDRLQAAPETVTYARMLTPADLVAIATAPADTTPVHTVAPLTRYPGPHTWKVSGTRCTIAQSHTHGQGYALTMDAGADTDSDTATHQPTQPKSIGEGDAEGGVASHTRYTVRSIGGQDTLLWDGDTDTLPCYQGHPIYRGVHTMDATRTCLRAHPHTHTPAGVVTLHGTTEVGLDAGGTGHGASGATYIGGLYQGGEYTTWMGSMLDEGVAPQQGGATPQEGVCPMTGGSCPDQGGYTTRVGAMLWAGVGQGWDDLPTHLIDALHLWLTGVHDTLHPPTDGA